MMEETKERDDEQTIPAQEQAGDGVEREELPRYEAPEQPEDPNLCKSCRRQRRDTTENANSVLCEECREHYIRYPVAKGVYVFLALVLVLLCVASVRIPKVLGGYKQYRTAELQMDNGEYSNALNTLVPVYLEYPESVPIATRLMDCAMVQSNYELAAGVLNESLVGKESGSDAEYNRINNYILKMEMYFETNDQIIEIMESSDDIEAQKTQVLKLLNNPSVDRSMVYWMMYGLTGDDVQESLGYLEKCVQVAPDFLQAKNQLGTMYRRLERQEDARVCYEGVLDYDWSDPLALRGLGVLELLWGDKEEGLELAREAYEIGGYASYLPEALAIALCENDLRDEANALVAELEANEYIIDPELTQYMAGEMSLQDYYIGF